MRQQERKEGKRGKKEAVTGITAGSKIEKQKIYGKFWRKNLTASR